MKQHAVVIAGGGPTGLMLAAELKLASVDVAIVERRATQQLDGSRAGGLNARSVELLDQRGVADRFVTQGTKHPVAMFLIPLAMGDQPTRHPYTLGLVQQRIENTLAAWVAELGVTTYRGVEVTGFTQGDAVDITLSDGSSLQAQYLVGCDGGRSVVRKTAGIDFAGWDASTSYMLAEVSFAEEPPQGFRYTAWGTHAIGKAENGTSRIVLEENGVQRGDSPTLDELKALLVSIYGTDYGVHSPTWISRFSDAARQAVAYRDRRVFVAGDAAHIHSPMGGQGLNTGLADAVNLAWKLARVIHGTSPDSLLDTYHRERHPIGARVLRMTMAQTALRRVDDRTKALHEVVRDILALEEPRKKYAAMISNIDIRYDLGEGHPLLGRRMPDLDLGGETVFSLLHAAQPVLINFGPPLAVDGVRIVDARYDGAWDIPGVGIVPAPAAVLIRPDGHVAWVGTGTDDGLRASLQWQ